MTMTDVVLFHRSTLKLYDSLLKEICDSCALSGLELTIISFLHNNPEYDTAKDISVFRMIPKGNVSQGVSSLIEKGLLERSPDAHDRRKIHLSLTERSMPLVEKVETAKNRFMELAFDGFSQEDWEVYTRLCTRVTRNVKHGLERKQNT
ncbi:MAG: MarR family winged helix-turn-helix transcriptional regulator [Butyricicoccus sp.]